MLNMDDRQQIRTIVREETLDLRVELDKQSILLEDMDSTLATVLELLVINLDIKTQAETLRSHSRQLKAKK